MTYEEKATEVLTALKSATDIALSGVGKFNGWAQLSCMIELSRQVEKTRQFLVDIKVGDGHRV